MQRDGNVRITTVLLKHLSDQQNGRYFRFSRIIPIIPIYGVLQNNVQGTFAEKQQLLKTLRFQNQKYSMKSNSNKAFKSIIENQALPSVHEGSLGIILKITLKGSLGEFCTVGRDNKNNK